MATTKLSTLTFNGTDGADGTKNEVYDGLCVGDYTVTLTYVGLYYGRRRPIRRARPLGKATRSSSGSPTP